MITCPQMRTANRRTIPILRRVRQRHQPPPIRSGGQSIGRDDRADIQIQGEGVSRRHCKITVQADGIWVEDLGSVNGTRVGGSLIHGIMRLRPGDTIDLGSAGLRLLRAAD